MSHAVLRGRRISGGDLSGAGQRISGCRWAALSVRMIGNAGSVGSASADGAARNATAKPNPKSPRPARRRNEPVRTAPVILISVIVIVTVVSSRGRAGRCTPIGRWTPYTDDVDMEPFCYTCHSCHLRQSPRLNPATARGKTSLPAEPGMVMGSAFLAPRPPGRTRRVLERTVESVGGCRWFADDNPIEGWMAATRRRMPCAPSRWAGFGSSSTTNAGSGRPRCRSCTATSPARSHPPPTWCCRTNTPTTINRSRPRWMRSAVIIRPSAPGTASSTPQAGSTT